jgi:hypothetical protein
MAVEDNGNPFADETLTNHPSVEAPPADGNPFSDPALTSPEYAQQQTGQVTNDVGNTVIVPKEGESFADTMKRAAAYGKTVTPQQINAEVRTMPGKAATVLAAAPVIGAAGAASLAAPGEISGAGERLLQMTESQLQRFAEAYPHLSKIATHLGISATPVGIYELLTRFGGKK